MIPSFPQILILLLWFLGWWSKSLLINQLQQGRESFYGPNTQRIWLHLAHDGPQVDLKNVHHCLLFKMTFASGCSKENGQASMKGSHWSLSDFSRQCPSPRQQWGSLIWGDVSVYAYLDVKSGPTRYFHVPPTVNLWVITSGIVQQLSKMLSIKKENYQTKSWRNAIKYAS